jgi:hypothetical protein
LSFPLHSNDNQHQKNSFPFLLKIWGGEKRKEKTQRNFFGLVSVRKLTESRFLRLSGVLVSFYFRRSLCCKKGVAKGNPLFTTRSLPKTK